MHEARLASLRPWWHRYCFASASDTYFTFSRPCIYSDLRDEACNEDDDEHMRMAQA